MGRQQEGSFPPEFCVCGGEVRGGGGRLSCLFLS